MNKAVFWDRDGVLNYTINRGLGNITAPWFEDEFLLYHDAKSALEYTDSRGYLNFVVTNQPDIKQGKMKRSTLEKFHSILMNTMPITNILYAQDKDSVDYKPNNGMLEYLIDAYAIDRSKSFMVGDRWKDIVAGYKSRLMTLFIDRNENQTYPDAFREIEPNIKCYSTWQAASVIGSRQHG